MDCFITDAKLTLQYGMEPHTNESLKFSKKSITRNPWTCQACLCSRFRISHWILSLTNPRKQWVLPQLEPKKKIGNR